MQKERKMKPSRKFRFERQYYYDLRYKKGDSYIVITFQCPICKEWNEYEPTNSYRFEEIEGIILCCICDCILKGGYCWDIELSKRVCKFLWKISR